MCCNTKILFLTVSGRGHSTVWLDLYSKGIAAVSQQNPSSKKIGSDHYIQETEAWLTEG